MELYTSIILVFDRYSYKDYIILSRKWWVTQSRQVLIVISLYDLHLNDHKQISQDHDISNRNKIAYAARRTSQKLRRRKRAPANPRTRCSYLRPVIGHFCSACFWCGRVVWSAFEPMYVLKSRFLKLYLYIFIGTTFIGYCCLWLLSIL